MDSLTQFTLGAAVATACLGSKMGPRKALIVGGLLGTLPDLDVLIPFETKIDEFVYHRGWSHSFFIHVLATPIIGEVLRRSFKSLRDHRLRVWTAVLLVLITHAIIDAMNSYGARIFWPFYPDPVGVGSVFIIDPFFTVPLLIAVVWALASAKWSDRLGKALVSAIVLSTAYMALSVVIQNHIHARGEAIFADKGIETTNIKTVVSPFNILFWRVIGQGDGKYHNLYVSVFDDDENAIIYTHEYDAALASCVVDDPEYQKMIWFSDGFVRTDLIDDKIVATDYRLGLTPTYIFQFAIADYADGAAKAMTPEPIPPSLANASSEFGWLGNRILGRPMARDSEIQLIEQTESKNLKQC